MDSTLGYTSPRRQLRAHRAGLQGAYNRLRGYQRRLVRYTRLAARETDNEKLGQTWEQIAGVELRGLQRTLRDIEWRKEQIAYWRAKVVA